MTMEFNFGILIYIGNGDGTFTAGTSLSSIYDPNFIATGDFNNDGKTDLVVTNYYGGYGTMFLGRGDGTFLPPTSFDSGGTQPSQFTVVDLNGDGMLDLAVVNGDYPLQGNIGLLYGNGDGTFQPSVNLASSTGYFYSSVLSGDFNGDGKVDLAVSRYDGVLILAGTASAALRVSMVPAGAGLYGAIIGNAMNGAPTFGPVVASMVQGTQSGGFRLDMFLDLLLPRGPAEPRSQLSADQCDRLLLRRAAVFRQCSRKHGFAHVRRRASHQYDRPM